MVIQIKLIARAIINERLWQSWNEYAIAFNNKLEVDNNGDWNKLDEMEQEIAAFWKLTSDMYSSDFDEFFLNLGYECYTYAMRGVKRVTEATPDFQKTDYNKIYELLDTTYNKVFARFENDECIKSYSDIMQYLTEEDEEILEDTYELFDEELGPVLCIIVYKYYCEELKKAV